MALCFLPVATLRRSFLYFTRWGITFGNSAEDLGLPSGALGLHVCTTWIDLQDLPECD